MSHAQSRKMPLVKEWTWRKQLLWAVAQIRSTTSSSEAEIGRRYAKDYWHLECNTIVDHYETYGRANNATNHQLPRSDIINDWRLVLQLSMPIRERFHRREI